LRSLDINQVGQAGSRSGAWVSGLGCSHQVVKVKFRFFGFKRVLRLRVSGFGVIRSQGTKGRLTHLEAKEGLFLLTSGFPV